MNSFSDSARERVMAVSSGYTITGIIVLTNETGESLGDTKRGKGCLRSHDPGRCGVQFILVMNLVVIMLTYLVSLAALALAVADQSVVSTESLKCTDIKDKSVPCVEVPRCTTSSQASVTIDQLSNGLGASQATSSVSLCFTDTALQVVHKAHGQKYLSPTTYTNCNDAIFYSDVAEFFIAPNMEQEPHCYNELDISPYNVMYDAGIYNPNLNKTSVQGTTFDCDSSNIEHTTSIDMPNHQWEASLSFPFALLNCPYKCPLQK